MSIKRIKEIINEADSQGKKGVEICGLLQFAGLKTKRGKKFNVANLSDFRKVHGMRKFTKRWRKPKARLPAFKAGTTIEEIKNETSHIFDAARYLNGTPTNPKNAREAWLELEKYRKDSAPMEIKKAPPVMDFYRWAIVVMLLVQITLTIRALT